MPTTIVPISLPKDLARELDRAARRDAMTRSEFVRDLIRRRLAFARLDEFRKEISSQARRQGIRTLRDAVRAVREIRESARP